MTTTTPPMTQKQLAAGILHIKRTYRKWLENDRNLLDEIHHHKRNIRLTSNNPFYNYKRSIWQKRINQLEAFLAKKRPFKCQVQDELVNWIRAFDQTGPAPIHVYAAILSTHHSHIQRALTEGAQNLMELIVYKVEDGASTADWVSQGSVLHHAVTKAVIRAMQHNDELQQFADNLLQQMVQESLGRPLRQYRIVQLPNGQTVAKSIPPKLRVV